MCMSHLSEMIIACEHQHRYIMSISFLTAPHCSNTTLRYACMVLLALRACRLSKAMHTVTRLFTEHRAYIVAIISIFAENFEPRTTMPTLTILHIALIYLAAINMVTFFLYGIDKFKAQHARWRIPESVLIGFAVIGGSIGAWLGMMIWHHKTQHKKFKYGIPLILVVQIALLILWWRKTMSL